MEKCGESVEKGAKSGKAKTYYLADDLGAAHFAAQFNANKKAATLTKHQALLFYAAHQGAKKCDNAKIIQIWWD